MPEGLKIVVGGDTTQANQALASFGKQIDLTELKIESFDLTVKTLAQRVDAFGGGVRSFGTSFRAVIPPIDKATTSLNRFGKTSSSATQASINLGRVIQDAPFGFLGIANNLNPLLESFQRLKAESGSTKTALKSLGSSLMGAGGLGLAVSLLSTGLILFGDKIFGVSKAAKKAKEETDQLKDSIKGVFSSVSKEAVEVGSLIAVLKNEADTRERKLSAIKQLKDIQPEIFAGLKLEGETVIGLDGAYQSYLLNLKNVIAAKLIQLKLDGKIQELLKLQGIGLTESEKKTNEFFKNIGDARRKAAEADPAKGGFIIEQFKTTEAQKSKALKDAQDDIEGLVKDLSEFSKSIEVKVPKVVNPDKIKQDFFNPLMNLLQRVSGTIGLKIPVDIGRLNLIQIQSDKLKSFKELVEEKIEKQLEGLVVKPELKISIVTDKATIAAAQLGKDTAEAFNSGFQQIAIEGFAAIGEALGTALSGGNIGDVFKGFVNTIGGAIQQIGRQMITLAVTAILAQKSLASLFTQPALALAAGVALVAAGTAMKGILNKGVKGFAAGGLVSGPQLALIGEGSGTSRSNPEVVAPLDKLRSMLTGLNGGGRQMVYVTGRLRGRDMVLQNARTERSQRRTTGR